MGVWGEPDAIEKYCSMAVIENEKLIAGTLFHNWQPDSGVIELTSFSTEKRWLTRLVVRAMFDLPFRWLGCQLVILRVSERNIGMCRIAKRFGFSEFYIPRLRGRDEGEFIYTLSDDQWKESPYNGQASSKST